MQAGQSSAFMLLERQPHHCGRSQIDDRGRCDSVVFFTALLVILLINL